jgi:hypothetical protein
MTNDGMGRTIVEESREMDQPSKTKATDDIEIRQQHVCQWRYLGLIISE